MSGRARRSLWSHWLVALAIFAASYAVFSVFYHFDAALFPTAFFTTLARTLLSGELHLSYRGSPGIRIAGGLLYWFAVSFCALVLLAFLYFAERR